MWCATPSFLQQTVVPAETVSAAGLKRLSPIETTVAPAGQLGGEAEVEAAEVEVEVAGGEAEEEAGRC